MSSSNQRGDEKQTSKDKQKGEKSQANEDIQFDAVAENNEHTALSSSKNSSKESAKHKQPNNRSSSNLETGPMMQRSLAFVQTARPITTENQSVSDDKEKAELKEDNCEILIINSENDIAEALQFKNHLIKDITFCINNQPKKPRVKLLREFVLEPINNLDIAFKKSLYVFLYITKNFCQEQETLIHGQACLTEAIADTSRNWCVIPVHTAPKKNQRYKMPMMLNCLRALQYSSINRDQFYVECVKKLLEARAELIEEKDRKLDEDRKNANVKAEMLRNCQNSGENCPKSSSPSQSLSSLQTNENGLRSSVSDSGIFSSTNYRAVNHTSLPDQQNEAVPDERSASPVENINYGPAPDRNVQSNASMSASRVVSQETFPCIRFRSQNERRLPPETAVDTNSNRNWGNVEQSAHQTSRETYSSIVVDGLSDEFNAPASANPNSIDYENLTSVNQPTASTTNVDNQSVRSSNPPTTSFTNLNYQSMRLPNPPVNSSTDMGYLSTERLLNPPVNSSTDMGYLSTEVPFSPAIRPTNENYQLMRSSVSLSTNTNMNYLHMRSTNSPALYPTNENYQSARSLAKPSTDTNMRSANSPVIYPTNENYQSMRLPNAHTASSTNVDYLCSRAPNSHAVSSANVSAAAAYSNAAYSPNNGMPTPYNYIPNHFYNSPHEPGHPPMYNHHGYQPHFIPPAYGFHPFVLGPMYPPMPHPRDMPQLYSYANPIPQHAYYHTPMRSQNQTSEVAADSERQQMSAEMNEPLSIGHSLSANSLFNAMGGLSLTDMNSVHNPLHYSNSTPFLRSLSNQVPVSSTRTREQSAAQRTMSYSPILSDKETLIDQRTSRDHFRSNHQPIENSAATMSRNNTVAAVTKSHTIQEIHHHHHRRNITVNNVRKANNVLIGDKPKFLAKDEESDCSDGDVEENYNIPEDDNHASNSARNQRYNSSTRRDNSRGPGSRPYDNLAHTYRNVSNISQPNLRNNTSFADNASSSSSREPVEVSLESSSPKPDDSHSQTSRKEI